MSNFKVYSSSAGSGKTYTLTKEYLKLVLQDNTDPFDPTYFRKVLAITFTNDAANEMKERILGTLKAFAQHEKQDLLEKISNEINLPAQLVAQRAGLVFQKIIYQYSDFSVSTIDSFMNKIISAFTQELNVPFNYELEMDTDTLMEKAIDSLISKVGGEAYEELTNFMVEFTLDQAESGSNWQNMARGLTEFSKKLLEDKSENIIQTIQQLSLSEFSQLIAHLKLFSAETQEQITRIAQNTLQLIDSKNLKDKDFFQGARGCPGYLNKHASGDFCDMNSHVQKCLEEDKWSTKPNLLIEEIAPMIKASILEIEKIKEEKKGPLKLSEEILKHLYKVSLTSQIRQEIDRLKQQNNLVHIAEINEKIARIIQNEPIPFLYERVGERYNHILIDEFQDTSILQWHNLIPLIENNLAEGRFNLVVGDAKQAIYRWRGGEMEQIMHLANYNIDHLVESAPNVIVAQRYQGLAPDLIAEVLDTNWRSAVEIVSFNNDFFSVLADRYEFEVQLVKQIYNEYFQQRSPESAPNGGNIEIVFKPSEEYEEQTLSEIEAIIQKVQKQGFAARDIAILCRQNTKAAQVATFLKEKGHEVVSSDSLLLSSDEKVNFLVAMLKVLDNPENSLAKSEALYLFHKVILHQIPDTQKNQAIRKLVYQKDATAREFWMKFAEEGYFIDYSLIQSLGLYEMIEELLIVFKIFENHTERLEYIFRFLDYALEFATQTSSHLNDFLEDWHKKKRSICVSTANDADAITITSIHKSKGLEFPVVVVPFADWQVTPMHFKTTWVNIEHSQVPLPNAQKQLLRYALMGFSEFADEAIAQQITEEKQKIMLENMNLLYVAFTRPVYQLYIISKESTKQQTVSQWLKMYLQQKELYQEGCERYALYEHAPQAAPPQKHPVTGQEVFALESLYSTSLSKKLSL